MMITNEENPLSTIDEISSASTIQADKDRLARIKALFDGKSKPTWLDIDVQDRLAVRLCGERAGLLRVVNRS